MLKRLVPLAFVLLWIVPVGWVGLMRSNYPLYPSWIASIFRVSGMFESAPDRWRIYFIEARDSENGKWTYVDEKTLFASTPLGNRTRFQQLMSEIGRKTSKEQLPKLLEWISAHRENTHENSEPDAFRIIHFGIPPETFLQHPSLESVYQTAYAENMPSGIDATLDVAFSSPSHAYP